MTDYERTRKLNHIKRETGLEGEEAEALLSEHDNNEHRAAAAWEKAKIRTELSEMQVKSMALIRLVEGAAPTHVMLRDTVEELEERLKQSAESGQIHVRVTEAGDGTSSILKVVMIETVKTINPDSDEDIDSIRQINRGF